MAVTSNIAWTRSTFNAWLGCTKVGPGCDGCYAETQDSRKRWGGTTHWGPGVPRYRTAPSNWAQVETWNRKAEIEQMSRVMTPDKYAWNGPVGYWPVFCNSLGDVFDNEVDYTWRADLFKLIDRTPYLSWLLVTKRIGNVRSMVPDEWTQDKFPDNVRILITVVNQEEADRDIPKLLALNCKNGVSYEPALGPVDWSSWLAIEPDRDGSWRVKSKFAESPELHWIIIGGESSQGAHAARPFNIQWARDTIAQCLAADTRVFMKQLGSNVASGDPATSGRYALRDRAGADPAEWPSDINVREFPEWMP